jgi:hypothetical protein
MCLWCAVPVRGATYGNECLSLVLGEAARVGEEPAPSRASVRPLAAFAAALATTVLPWTTFGEGASMFGAWGLSARWSMVAAVASVLGLVAAVGARRRPRPDRRWELAQVLLGAIVALGALLEWFRPPFPSRPSIVPWIASAAGAYAAVSAVRSVRAERASVG